MNPTDTEVVDQIRQSLHWLEERSARFWAQTAARTAGERMFDDYLVTQLRRGWPFGEALCEASARFPEGGGVPDPGRVAEMESRCRFLATLQEADELRATLESMDERLREAEEQMSEFTAPTFMRG
jgi:hypothetical protein